MTAIENSSENSTRAILPSMTPQQRMLTQTRGLAGYRAYAFGEVGLAAWMYGEIVTTLFSGLAGIVGLGARSIALPPIFSKCGSRPAFGRGFTVRRPAQIQIGERCVVDEFVSLEVRGTEGSITLGDRVSIGRLSTVVAKDSPISIGSGSNIGSYCRLATESRLEIGESVLIAAYAYIGAGNHQPGSHGGPLIEQPMDRRGGVRICSHAWIGAGAMIMDGVTIGERAIVGAQSLVLEDVPADAVVVGSPARIIRVNQHQGAQ